MKLTSLVTCSVLASAPILALTSTPSSGEASATRDTSKDAVVSTVPGIKVLQHRPEPSPALSGARKAALLLARADAAAHGGKLAPPYFTRDGNTLVVTGTTKWSLKMAQSRNIGRPARTGPRGGSVRSATQRIVESSENRPVLRYHLVGHSFDTLEHIKDDVTRLTNNALSNASSIYASYVDDRRNRVIIEATSVTPTMLRGLRARYGADTLAVVVPQDARTGPPVAVRNDDNAPFWGGGRIINWGTKMYCTAGLPFRRGTTHYMLSAGHCASIGGYFRTGDSSTYFGSVVSGTSENWTDGVGTATFASELVAGDMSLIYTHGAGGSEGNIYVGGVNSSLSRRIERADFTYVGDQYCTGGSYSGEICGWKVNSVFANHRYGTGEWVRNVAIGYKRGPCVRPGDSGGPVYNVQASGYVRVKGMISGEGGHGGSDYFTGALESPCRNVFTDVWRAVDAWGGAVMTR